MRFLPSYCLEAIFNTTYSTVSVAPSEEHECFVMIC